MPRPSIVETKAQIAKAEARLAILKQNRTVYSWKEIREAEQKLTSLEYRLINLEQDARLAAGSLFRGFVEAMFSPAEREQIAFVEARREALTPNGNTNDDVRDVMACAGAERGVIRSAIARITAIQNTQHNYVVNAIRESGDVPARAA